MEEHSHVGLVFRSVVISALVTIGIVAFVMRDFEDRIIANIQSEAQQVREDLLPMDTGEAELADVVEETIPAVVSVVISADVPIIERFYEEYNPFGFFGDRFGFSVPRERQVGTEEREIGGGSGFFISKDGFIVTNRHVVDVEDARFSIVTHEGETYDVAVVAKDPTLDIAVLKVTEANGEFPYLEFGDSETIRLGDTVIAIGNALAEFPNSVSVGVVSGLARNIVAGGSSGSFEQLEGVIQTDAAINRGNSGGPLLNNDGKVIGVNVAVAGSGENIGFALPGSVVKAVYDSVAEFGEIVRPFLGVRYMHIDGEVRERNNLTVDYGVLIVRGETSADLAVIPGSPADMAGLEENDIILEIDGRKLDGNGSFASIIRTYSVGDSVNLKVLHDGEEKNVTVTLEKLSGG